MKDRDRSKTSESNQSSLANRETVAPSSFSDSVPMGSGPFSQLPAAFGRFRVSKLLGHGAMGTVYLAFDSDLDKDVALKIPKADLNQDVVLWERFQREARAVGDLNHPNICGMYEVGQVGTTHFISMEYIDGRPLSDFISDGQSQRRVVGVIRKLADGLAHAHQRGIVHRDLKPANVMIDAKGEPKLMDFGLARRLDSQDVRATQSGMIVGSPAYMSPEQARAEHDKIGPTTDIYGLGVLFYEMLTGSLPFRGQMVVMLGQIATQLPPRLSTLRPDVDPQLESLCLKMLAKKQRDRPQSMNEVVQTLVDWLKSENASPYASASDPSMMAIAKVEPLAPVKLVSAKIERTDPTEAQRQRVNDLLAKHQYTAAIDLLEKIVNLKDARFEKLVAWGRECLPEVWATERKMREASLPLCATARKLLKRYDYNEAVKVLSSVPIQYRSLELREMLHQAAELKEECDQLQCDIDDSIRSSDTESLPALVKRFCKLKPNNKAIQQLAMDLKRHGAAKVVARRKGQRRFLDPARHVIEPKQIALRILFVAGLFIGVSLLLQNYLANTQPSRPVTLPDRPMQPNPPSATVTIDPQESIPTPPLTKSSDSLPRTMISQFTGMKLTLIPPGTFQMGSPAGEAERSADEGPLHFVRISRPFYMGVTEVTRGEYEKVMGTNPSKFTKTDDVTKPAKYPVENISWYDAIEFCNKLSERDDLSEYYTLSNVERNNDSIKSATVAVIGTGLSAGENGYRLPTEAEWEYACRGNTATEFNFGSISSGDKANINGNGPYGTTTKGTFRMGPTKVGLYGSNAFGLSDMHGNVWEWCFDVYDESAYGKRSGTPTDPLVTTGSDHRVLRGGSWFDAAASSRSACRHWLSPDYRDDYFGFRVVRYYHTSVTSPAKKTSKPTPTPESIVKTDPLKVPSVEPSTKLTKSSDPLPQTMISQFTGMTLALIPAGTFQMGSPANEAQRENDEGPQHTVWISRSFYMGVHEVTQGQYKQVMGTNPSYFTQTWPARAFRLQTSKSKSDSTKVSGRETVNFPVDSISWYDAIEFCNKLSERDGLSAYYALSDVERNDGSIQSATVAVIGTDSSSRQSGYRLPTEAEWEYACRGKTTTPFSFGSVLNGDKANINGNYPYGMTKGKYWERPTTVGSYWSNAFGLSHMHGNVNEWCFDVYDESAYGKRIGTTTDPLVTTGSAMRVLRGGSWDHHARFARSAFRFKRPPDSRSYQFGFRVVR